MVCGAGFTTYERTQVCPISILRKGEGYEEFNSDKPCLGIRKSFDKHFLPARSTDELVDSAENKLRQLNRTDTLSSYARNLIRAGFKNWTALAIIRFLP